jgi:hypothetical protein
VIADIAVIAGIAVIGKAGLNKFEMRVLRTGFL